MIYPKLRGHHHSVGALARTYPDRKDLRILDVGAGTGVAGQEVDGSAPLDNIYTALWLWEGEPANNKETNAFPTPRSLEQCLSHVYNKIWRDMTHITV